MSRMIDDEETLKDNGLIEIDGVDVSECCCYESQRCLWSKKYYEIIPVPLCKEIKDCYYKQLQRLKAENEKLKEDIERRKQWRVNSIYTIKKLSDNAKAYIRAFNCSIQEINELRMENEKLKAENERFENKTSTL